MDRGLWHCTGGTDQDHHLGKEMQKGKLIVWGGLTNSWEKRRKRQRRKGKIYSFECRFQKIARRDKKAFLSDQYKEIEENNRIGKTRGFFNDIGDTKETFYAKMGTIKDRNGMDLTKTEDIKKKWQEYTQSVKVAQSCHSLWLYGLYCSQNSLGHSTGVGSLSLLQGIFPTQGSNPGLPHCRQILYCLSH